jgi:hypothetical protein
MRRAPNPPVQHARIRPISAYAAFEQSAAANGGAAASSGVISAMPEISAPVSQISRQFLFQSYFDDTLLEKALLEQSANEPIVQSTSKEEQIPGYAIGLHPSSQTPVAIEFRVGGQPSSSHAITLKPGQIVRPHGQPRGGGPGQFSGFRWGLPFGWLGGGMAHLLVFQTSDSDVLWPGNPEVIFHRTRMQILDPAALPATRAPINWPMRFPWINAVRGATSINQRGQPNIGIVPTRVLMTLRLDTLAAPADMRLAFQGTNDFGLDAAGVIIPAETVGFHHTWGTWAPPAGGAGNLATTFQVDFLAERGMRLAADDGGVALIDMSVGGDLIDAFVDVVRFGTLG